MDSLPIYEAARDYLRDPDKWCQNQMEDQDGRRCINGALCHAVEARGGRELGLQTIRAMQDLVPIVRRLDPTLKEVMGPAVYNDTHSHAEVLELLNIAIAELQAERAASAEPATEREPCLTAA